MFVTKNLGGRGQSLLLKTGQETSYETGDDGDLELGVAKDYTVLTTGQYTGTTNIVINGKTHALSNNCVKDNRTGKMWARYVPVADIGPATDGNLFWKQWTLENKTTISFDEVSKEIRDSASDFDVKALCDNRRFTITGSASNDGTFNVNGTPTTSVIVVDEIPTDEGATNSITLATVDDLIWDALAQANANSLGGYNDWRIPNYYELASIVDLDSYDPCIDETSFPSTPIYYHWITSTRQDRTTRAFIVNFGYGNVSYGEKQTSKWHVRFIRG